MHNIMPDFNAIWAIYDFFFCFEMEIRYEYFSINPKLCYITLKTIKTDEVKTSTPPLFPNRVLLKFLFTSIIFTLLYDMSLGKSKFMTKCI